MSEGYRFTGPALAHLAERVEQRPGIVSAQAIGHSGKGLPIWAFHVRPAEGDIHEEVLIVAGIHALEWIGSEVAFDLLDELIERPIPGVSVTVVPILNPDGRRRVELDLLDGRGDRYHRGNAEFIDLNRDFATNREARAFWRHLIPARYETSPAPLSQPETRALDDLAASHAYTRAASLHAFGGYLYFPWSGRWSRPDDWSDFVATGRAMERAQGSGAYRPRQLSRWGFFFRAQGSEIDHLYAVHGIAPWLIEITRSGLRWPSDRRTPFRWYNPRNPDPHLRRSLAAVNILLQALPRENDLN